MGQRRVDGTRVGGKDLALVVEAVELARQLLDVVGDEATLGKPIGSDVRSDKTTFVALKGLADCRILVAELTDRAVEALAPFGSEAESLRGLAQSLAGREK